MKSSIFLSLATLGIASFLSAATLTNITTAGVSIADVYLSDAGDTNWAAWNTTQTGQSSISATQSKKAGTGTISDMLPSGGTDVRGTSTTGGYSSTDFTWTTTDETSNSVAPGSGVITGIFNGTLNSAVGVTFNITDLPTLTGGLLYQVNVYTTAYYAQGSFNAVIGAGTPTPTQLGNSHTSNKYTDYFSLAYNPDGLSDVLNITFADNRSHSNTNNFDHVAIQAVAISVIPEPSSFAMVLGTFALLFAFRKHSRR